MTSNSATGSVSTHRPAWLYFLAVMLAYAVVILSAKTPPHLLDYPDWVYQGVLFRGVLTGHPFPGYALKPYPVPNSLTTIGLGLLSTVFTWQMAARLWICLYVLLAAISTFLLARAFHRAEPRLIIAAPSILFLNLDFWYGHISFEIGMCLFMILVALLLRNARPVTLALLMVLIFFAHMEAFACALLLIAFWIASTRAWKKLWIAVPGVILTLWYAVARFAHGNTDDHATGGPHYTYGSSSFFVYKANTFFKPFGYVNARTIGGQSLSEAALGRDLLVLLAGLSLILAVLILMLLLRATLVGNSRTPGHIRAVILVLLAATLFLPQALLGTADPGSRLLLAASVLGLFLFDWRSRTAALITALSVIFCAANLWQFARIQHNPDLQPHAEDLPAPMLTYGHVEPLMRDFYYQHLSAGQMNLYIFPTGMFVQKR